MIETLEDGLQNYLRKEKVGFIGAGNMAKAIAGGLITKGMLRPEDLYASAPSDNNLKWWKSQGSNTTHINEEIVRSCGVVFLAIKPQYLKEVLSAMPSQSSTKLCPLFVSVLAGVETETLEKLVLPILSSARVVRVMPNTPLLVGSGCSVYCGGMTATESDLINVKGMLSQSGICVEVKESMMNAAGAISGCGPAFMYLVIEAMADGGVQMGLPRQMAQGLAAQTMKGAAEMVLQTGRHPGELKDEVCSPGGTTIAGVCTLEKHAVRSAIIAAIEAAAKKSIEMGRKC